MLSKKEKRWESKKRKIQAFLDVAKLNEYEKEAQLPKRPRIEQNKESLTCEDKVFKSRDRQTITERTLGCEIVSDDRNDVEHNDSSKTQEELVALRKQLKARQKANMEKPKVFLTPEQLFMEKYSTATPIIFTLDIQHLLLYAIQGNISSYKPRWCRLLRWSKVSQVMVIVVEDSCAKDLIQFADSAPYLCARFEMKIELAAPQQYGSSIEKELFRVPLSKRKIKDKEAKAEECENYDDAKKYGKMYRNVIPLEPVIADHPESMGVEGVISPVDIMLSPEQMIQEGYPLPIQGQYQHYKFTKDVYSKVTRYSPVFGLDCEMCLTTSGKNELTRVSVVNTKSETIYDSLVKPYNTITNYLTRYSGITKEILQDVTTRLEDVQHVLQEIIPPDAIIVGQSLNGDLHALQMLHPYVIDTSVIYNLSGDRTRKTGLRRLAAEFLDRQIQNDPAGHNPCEDARAAMDLVLLKLKKGLLFGDVVLGGYQPHLGGWFEADKEDTSQQQIPDDGEESEEIQSKIHIAENSMSENRINTAALIEKRKLFFERPGNSYENFFDLVKDSKKSVMVVGTESNLAGIDGNVKKVEVSSDKEAVKVISNTETEHFLNCLYLKKFESCDCSDEENIKMSLGKVDKRIRKLMKRLRENTLCMVIFTGRITDNFYVENGYCLVNVT